MKYITCSLIISFGLIIVALNCLNCNGADMTDISRLRATLLTNYDSHARPVQSHKNATSVEVYIFNHGIEFDEVKGILTLHCMPVFSWQDEHLKWDPLNYGNITDIQFSSTELWKPDISVINNGDTEIDHFGNTLIMVNHNSDVFWVPPAKFLVACEPDYRKWPYDTQQCDIILGSWSHDGSDVQLIVSENHTELAHDLLWNPPLENREWKVMGNYIIKRTFFYPSVPEIPFMDILISLTIERRSSTHTAAITVVALGIAAAVCISFWLSPYANERVPVILVAMFLNAFYLNVVYDRIPNAGSSVPFAVSFFRDSLILVIVALAWTVGLRYLSKSTRTSTVPLPAFINVFRESIVAKILCLDARPTVAKGNTGNQAGGETMDDNDELVKQESPYQESWLWLAHLLDRVGFLIYFIIYAIFIIMFSL